MKHLDKFKYFLKENIDSIEWDSEEIDERFVKSPMPPRIPDGIDCTITITPKK